MSGQLSSVIASCRDNAVRVLTELAEVVAKTPFSFDEWRNNIAGKVSCDEVKKFVDAVFSGAEPESALREYIFNGLLKSMLDRAAILAYLPEQYIPFEGVGEGLGRRRGAGVVDYMIYLADDLGLILELKSPIVLNRSRQKIERRRLNPETQGKQVAKYLLAARRIKAKYALLTDGTEAYLYSTTSRVVERHVCRLSAKELAEVLSRDKLFSDEFRRLEETAEKEVLSDEFFEALSAWIKRLRKVPFKTRSDAERDELVLSLISKLVFAQTLVDHGVAPYPLLIDLWYEAERLWKPRGAGEVVRWFLERLDEWFYSYYDTELFKLKIVDYISDDDLDKLYGAVRDVLGVVPYPVMPFRGVTRFDYRLIDEDVLGRAYETVLAEARKPSGIYYTPKFVAEYIVETTVGRIMDKLADEVIKAIERGDYDQAETRLRRMISVKVLDPACGSGSFLIKALRAIYRRYNRVNKAIERALQRSMEEARKGIDAYQKWIGIIKKLKKMQEILGENPRHIVTKILIRHIYGNDVDPRALEIAKLNLWLEAIKLAKDQFRYTILGREGHTLPDLSVNLSNGDALVGLPDNVAINLLSKHKEQLTELFKLRHRLLNNPSDASIIAQINSIKRSLRGLLNEEFKRYAIKKGMPYEFVVKAKPLHWPLEFWHVFFNENGDPKPLKDRGFDAVIGNPPYVRIQTLRAKWPSYVLWLNKEFKTLYGDYDLAIPFIERGYTLLSQGGRFGYIVTKKWMKADYGVKLRALLANEKAVDEIIDFGDQQVFENTTTYTMILVLSGSPCAEFRYMLVKKLERSLEQLNQIRKNKVSSDVEVFTVKSENLSCQPWVFDTPQETNILKVIQAYPKLEEVSERIFQGLVTGADKVYLLQPIERINPYVKVFSRATKSTHILESDLLKPALMGKDIRRWTVGDAPLLILFPYRIEVKNNITERAAKLINQDEMRKMYPNTWKYLTQVSTLLRSREHGKWKSVNDWYAYSRRQNLEFMDLPKVIIQVLSSRATVMLDEHGEYYFVGGGNAGAYGITLKQGISISLRYLCGLLNSYLFDWYVKRKSDQFQGGYYSFAKRFIKDFPVKIPSSDEEKRLVHDIENLVSNIVKLIHKLQRFEREWRQVFYRNDVSKIQRPNLRYILSQKNWITQYNLSKNTGKYKYFKVYGYDPLFIEVFGVDENGHENRVLELRFANTETATHVYLAIKEALGTSRSINTPEELLDKLTIPLINGPGGALKATPEVIKKLKQKFGGFNPLVIDNNIREIEAKINALVFRLYGLTRDQVETILQRLNTQLQERALIIKHYSRLAKQS